MIAKHSPVMLDEVMDALAPKPEGYYFDGTLGHAGHTLAILRHLQSKGFLIAVDRDKQMLETARETITLQGLNGQNLWLAHQNHQSLTQIVQEAFQATNRSLPVNSFGEANFEIFDGILLDLGPSTPQLTDPERGMSFDATSLDMRMDLNETTLTAKDILNTWDEKALENLFFHKADERWARRIAQHILSARKLEPIESGHQLARIVENAIPRAAWPPKTHPATRIFMALRIEVNQEFEAIERVLPQAFSALRNGGRLAVITFHSGEDRRVKAFMKHMATPQPPPWPLPQGDTKPPATFLFKKPLEPTEEEIEKNPRSRSAKLRVIVKQC